MAIAVCQDDSIYADDTVLFLMNPIQSLPLLLQKLSIYTKLSGYKINQTKSEIILLNMSEIMKEKLVHVTQDRWRTRGIRYLGMIYSSKIIEVVDDNVMKLYNTIKHQLEVSHKLILS